jgi:hypothetical protein
MQHLVMKLMSLLLPTAKSCEVTHYISVFLHYAVTDTVLLQDASESKKQLIIH